MVPILPTRKLRLEDLLVTQLEIVGLFLIAGLSYGEDWGFIQTPSPLNSKVIMGGFCREVNTKEETRDPKFPSLSFSNLLSHCVSLLMLPDLAESMNNQSFSNSQTLS